MYAVSAGSGWGRELVRQEYQVSNFVVCVTTFWACMNALAFFVFSQLHRATLFGFRGKERCVCFRVSKTSRHKCLFLCHGCFCISVVAEFSCHEILFSCHRCSLKLTQGILTLHFAGVVSGSLPLVLLCWGVAALAVGGLSPVHGRHCCYAWNRF